MPVSLLSPADLTSPRVSVGCGAATPVRPGSELENGETGIQFRSKVANQFS
jgi:hypothetical protein